MPSAQPSHDFGRYADPRPMLAQVFGSLRPPSKVRVSDYAAKTRRLNNVGGGFVGPWDNDVAPYLVEPMDEFHTRIYDTAALVGPAQCGKTAVMENAALLHKVPNKPGKVLWYMQTDDGIESYVKEKINPLIAEHDVLSGRLGGRATDDTLHYKGFENMSIEFLSFNRGNLVNKSAGVVIGDEIDAYDPSMGDPWQLFDPRRQTYGAANSMIFGASHPDRALGLNPDKHWQHGIMRWYRDSTQGRWYWPCPTCGRFCSPNPGAKWVCELVHRKEPDAPLDEVALSAHLVCPHNGCRIGDGARRIMNRRGTWVHIGQDIETMGRVEGTRIVTTNIIGWWIVGVMSPFIIGGLGGLARKIVAAERAYDLEGDEDTLREVYSKSVGIPREIRSDKHAPIDAKLLAARADQRVPLGVLPDDVRFITIAVDTQGNRFVVQVEGWGVDLERWIIDRFDILRPKLAAGERDRTLSPASYPEDWDVLADELLNRAWPFGSDLDRGLKPVLVVFDAFGEPGVTDNAYDFWLRMRDLGHGRSLMPLKGIEGFGHPRVVPSFLEAEKKDRFSALRGEVPVLLMRVNPLKDSVAAGLRRDRRGGRFINFPAGLKQGFYDEYVAETRGPKGWVKTKTRNESLDLSAYNLGAVYHLQADKIDWSAPPVWAVAAPGNPYMTTLRVASTPTSEDAQMENHGVRVAAPARANQNIVDRLV